MNKLSDCPHVVFSRTPAAWKWSPFRIAFAFLQYDSMEKKSWCRRLINRITQGPHIPFLHRRRRQNSQLRRWGIVEHWALVGQPQWHHKCLDLKHEPTPVKSPGLVFSLHGMDEVFLAPCLCQLRSKAKVNCYFSEARIKSQTSYVMF